MMFFQPGDLVVPVDYYDGIPHELIGTGFILGEIVNGNATLVDVHIICANTNTFWRVGSVVSLLYDRFRKLN